MRPAATPKPATSELALRMTTNGIAARGRRAGRGFTLLETLVAFAIVTIVVVAALRGLSAGTQASRLGDDIAAATAIAENLYAETGRTIPLKAGRVTGRAAERFDWQVDLAPRTGEAPPDLYELAITVRWRDGTRTRSVTLRSLRLAGVGAG
jgi:general secretion pathway protein I